MKPTIHIHYNASDFSAPDGENDYWRNYLNPDSAKMFLVCAESWLRHGWQVKRLVSPTHTGFVFLDKLKQVKGNIHSNYVDKALQYPIEFWNWWFVVHKFCDSKGMFICTTDCINNGFTPEKAVFKLSARISDNVSFGKDWTNTCCYVTTQSAREAIQACYSVDTGRLSMPEIMAVSDESIFRKHGHWQGMDLLATPFLDKGWEEKLLLHYSRSMLVRGINAFGTLPESTPILEQSR